MGRGGVVNIPPRIGGRAVVSIGYGAFQSRITITSITIPEGVTQIGENAFADCNIMESVTLPNSLTRIGNSAFSGCLSLTSIRIPANVTNIGSNAFANCQLLTSVTIMRTSTGATFSGTQIGNRNVFIQTHENMQIRVPANSLNAYRNAANWSNLNGVPVSRIVAQ